MQDFKYSAMKELTEQQTRYAPPARRQEQVSRAERLLTEIEPGKSYPYQYVCFRVTDYRSDSHPDLLLGGDDLRNDLTLFIRRVERSCYGMSLTLKSSSPQIGLGGSWR